MDVQVGQAGEGRADKLSFDAHRAVEALQADAQHLQPARLRHAPEQHVGHLLLDEAGDVLLDESDGQPKQPRHLVRGDEGGEKPEESKLEKYLKKSAGKNLMIWIVPQTLQSAKGLTEDGGTHWGHIAAGQVQHLKG